MNDLPSPWRVELFHPRLVHFPVALLTLATAAYLLQAVVFSVGRGSDSSARGAVRCFQRGALFLGVLFGWGAVYTGELAHDVVNRVICDPGATHDHERVGLWCIWLYSLELILTLTAWITRRVRRNSSSQRATSGTIGRYSLLLAESLAPAVSLLAATTLVYTAHLGGNLVYQQGAAVYWPLPECRGYE